MMVIMMKMKMKIMITIWIMILMITVKFGEKLGAKNVKLDMYYPTTNVYLVLSTMMTNVALVPIYTLVLLAILDSNYATEFVLKKD